MLFAPLLGWRHVKVTELVRELLDIHLPARRVVLVMDNLNIHRPACSVRRLRTSGSTAPAEASGYSPYAEAGCV